MLEQRPAGQAQAPQNIRGKSACEASSMPRPRWGGAAPPACLPGPCPKGRRGRAPAAAGRLPPPPAAQAHKRRAFRGKRDRKSQLHKLWPTCCGKQLPGAGLWGGSCQSGPAGTSLPARTGGRPSPSPRTAQASSGGAESGPRHGLQSKQCLAGICTWLKQAQLKVSMQLQQRRWQAQASALRLLA